MPKQTGPKSEEGKQIASRNSFKHGLTSRKNLVDGENEQEQQALLAQWHEAYPTHNDHARNLVTTAAHAEWQLLRIQRGVDQLHCQLFPTPMLHWTAEQHHQFQLFTRYLTTAQRALDRHRTAILQYRRELRAEARQQLLETKTAAKTKEPESNPEPKPEPSDPYKPTNDPMSQYIYIRPDKNGVMETFYCQANELILSHSEFCFEHTIVRRLLEFAGDTVPPEYAWCADEVKLPKTGVALCLLMTMRSLRIAVEREKEIGHVRRWEDLLEQDREQIEEHKAKWHWT